MNKRVEWGAELRVSKLGGDKRYQQAAQLLSSVDTLILNISMGIELDDFDTPKPGAEPRVESVEVLTDGHMLLRMSRRRSGPKDDSSDFLRVDRLETSNKVFAKVLEAIVEVNTTSTEFQVEDLEVGAIAIDELLPQLRVRIDSFFPSSVELKESSAAEASASPTLFPVSKGNRLEDIAQAVKFVFPRTLNELIKGVSEAYAEELLRLHYLGPLRSFPPRHLAFAEHEDANWYAGGGYAWDVVRRDDLVRDAVNGWLGSDKLKTPYRLEVRSLVDTKALQRPIELGVDHFLHGDLDSDRVQAILEGENIDYQKSLTFFHRRGEAITEQVDRIVDEWKPRYERLIDAEEKARMVESIRQDVAKATEDVYANEEVFTDSDELIWEEYEEDIAKAIVERIEKADVPTLRELVLVDIRKNTVVTHRDVGIGISQVLPVLVMAYASKSKLLAMEQPEIHLHPALQAELGDAFIESALGERQNTFILETHSEHLILRLMRRMRETYQGKETGLPPITPDDISVLYVEPDGARSIVREMPLNELGELVKSWPGGFFEEGLREQIGDA